MARIACITEYHNKELSLILRISYNVICRQSVLSGRKGLHITRAGIPSGAMLQAGTGFVYSKQPCQCEGEASSFI